MKPLVTAVLVANGDSEYLSVTLAALRNQTRPVDRLLLVDTSSDRGLAQITIRGGESLIQTGQIKNLAAAISACQPLELVAETAQNWLWLLHDDSAPTATALELLLRTAEVSPSVAAIGPKLVDWNNPRRIQQLGLTLTPGGEIFSPVSGELDQAQHDALDDVLAISTAGMLIRTDVYAAVGGLDAGAPNLAADVELCVRVRRAGLRVAVAPEARVAHAGLSLAGQRPRSWLGGSPRTALRRANAHLRIAYSPLLIALLLVVFAPVIGVLRAAWAIASKHPNRIWAELSTGFWVFLTGFSRLAGRARANRGARITLQSLGQLRATRAQLRQRRLADAALDDQALDSATDGTSGGASHAEASPLLQDGAVDTTRTIGDRLSFAGAGGPWIALALIALSLRFWPTNIAAVGGGSLALSADWYSLFTHAGASYQQIGLGFYGPSDPFNWVLLALGSLTPWQPSLGLALFLLLAKALAFAGAWRALSLITARAWLRNIGALAFALWPTLSQAQLDARVPAIVATVALPWLTFAIARAAGLGKYAPRRSASRTWSWVGVAGLLLLAVGASAPNLLPALFAAIVVVLFTRLRRFGYLFWTPLPLAAALAPLVWFEAVGLLQPLTTLADPGVAVPSEPQQFWQLLLGGSIGADKTLFGLGAYSIWFTVPVILIAILATLSKRFVFAASLWLLVLGSLVSAWLVQRLDFAAVGVGSSTTALERVGGSPSALLGLAAMGLIALLVVALDRLPSKAWRGIAYAVVVFAMLLPSAAVFAANSPAQRFTDGRAVPSIVAAETARGSQLKTLVLRDTGFDAMGQRKLTAELVSGDGIQLDDLSLAYRFALAGLAGQRAEYGQVGQLVADLSSSNSADLTKPLQDSGIGYVLLPETRSTGARQLAISLEAADELESVGKTEYGQLWRVKHPNPKLAVAPESVPSPWSITKIIQLIVIAAFVLLAIPGRSSGSGTRRESEIFMGQTDEPNGGDEFD